VVDERQKMVDEFKLYLAQLEKMLLEPIEGARLSKKTILELRSHLEATIEDFERPLSVIRDEHGPISGALDGGLIGGTDSGKTAGKREEQGADVGAEKRNGEYEVKDEA